MLPYKSANQASKEPPEPKPDFRLAKVEQWRFDRLVAAGFTETQALWVALDRAIDLHKAVALRKQTELAFKILT